MNIFLAQQNYIIGDFEYNTGKIIAAIKTAKQQDAELIVFPELAVCGYPPRDFLEFEDFIDECLKSVHTIAAAAEGIAVLVGAPSRNPDLLGKNLFNSAYFLADKKIVQVINKTLLPNYDIFDEYRYFEPAFDWNIVTYKGLRLAVTICEDIWDMEQDPLYRFSPMEKLATQQPDLMINLSASPFDYTHAEDRYWAISQNCRRYGLPMLYCNTVGSQTEIIFDGGSLLADAEGNMVYEGKYFEEELTGFTFEQGQWQETVKLPVADLPILPFSPAIFDPELNIDRIHQALVMGIREYFEKMGFRKAIVASSGGIDSALTLALACEALGADNVHAILMPSQFSTGHSVDDAVRLSENLKNRYDIIPIKSIYDAFESSLQPLFAGLPFGIAEENIQSRTRGNLVMAIANKFNYILLNTSNKSELATGYGTLYGDMAGGLAVLGDVYKMQVFALCRYINRNGAIIPENIITKPPSAELRPDQKDSDSLPEYNILDAIIYQYVELRKSPQDLVEAGFEAALVKRVIGMINRNEYKRNQFCPIIRVSPKSFGLGRRMPIVGKYLS
ncbi:MAG: NAD+ synthase [Bacteroidetes bacterium 43-16]|nr:MAG: NAD+ synthase [Bacteroidetes bacterium 43-16]